MQPVRNSHIIRYTLRHYLAAGKAFNPLHAYGKNDPEALSLRIVEGFCRDVNYRYASGVNCVYLNFDKISACHPAAAGPRGR